VKHIALCYIRKSLVKEGGVDPASPEIQRRQLAAWCDAASLSPEYHEDADGHQSGRNLRRVGWVAARARLSDPDVAALVVTSWERAARSAQELLAVADACERASARFVSVADNIDTRTADGRLQLTILAGVAEHYSRRVGEWRAAAIDQLRRNRGRHYGTAPFGTRRIPQGGDLVLVPSDLEQPNGTDHDALALVYRWFTTEHLSYYTMSRRLNADGWRFRDRRGGLRLWAPEDVRRVVKQHWIYSGHVVIGQSDRGSIEVIPGSHRPILPGPLTQAAGLREASFRAQGKRRNLPRTYPLTGLLYCAACGVLLRGMGYDPRSYGWQHACEAGSKHVWHAEPIERAAREYLARMAPPSELLAAAETNAAAILATSTGHDEDADAARIEAALDRIVDLYATGQIDRDRYERKLSEYQALRRPARPTVPGIVVPELGAAILDSPPLLLRDVARLMLDRLDIGPDGLAITPQPCELPFARSNPFERKPGSVPDTSPWFADRQQIGALSFPKTAVLLHKVKIWIYSKLWS
jgi:site-specific DNA recombinase